MKHNLCKLRIKLGTYTLYYLLTYYLLRDSIPVATVGVNAAQNAAILAVEMLALTDEAIAQRLADYKSGLKAKIEKANKDLAEVKYQFKTN